MTTAAGETMLPLMIGIGAPVFAVIAFALLSPDPGVEDDEEDQ